MTTGKLFVLSERGPVDGVIRKLEGRWTVFVSTPTEFVVAVADGGVLQRTGEDLWAPPPRTFQLQAFNGTTELRWIARGDSGRVAWVSEDRDALPDGSSFERPFVDVIDAQAVLWGDPEGTEDAHFSRWTAARIGTAHYPVAAGAHGQRAVLCSREYLSVDGYGNANVFERRITALEVVNLVAAQGVAR